MHIEESSLNKVTTRQVLIVDDDEDLCRMIAEYLSRRGWNVLAAHTGRRARELLRSNVVALILLDIGLPDCSGFAYR